MSTTKPTNNGKENFNISTLGLCKKCGKLITGFDAVTEEMCNPKSKAAGILTAADISPKTAKELKFRHEKCGSELPMTEIPATMDEIGSVLGKRTGIIMVLDDGFYKSLTK